MQLRSMTATLLVATTSAAIAPAQGLDPLLVTDTTGDAVWRCVDTNGDGDYTDLGEVTPFHDEAVAGTIDVQNNVSIEHDGAGRVYMSDTGADAIYLLEDLNGDGDANDGGEAIVFFDGDPANNASGVTMNSPNGICLEAPGKLWVANAGAGSTPADTILLLEDSNGDGDANDAGEALVFFDSQPGGSNGDSILQDVRIGNDGRLYYLEIGSTGVVEKGVYVLEDLDSSGTIDAPGEVSEFFIPAAQANSAFFWAFNQDGNDYWYMADTFNDLIWRFRDDDASGSIDVGTEDVLYWTAPSSSLIWELTTNADGVLYASESQSPDRLLVMRDVNGDDVIDPVGEVTEVYDDTLPGIVDIEGPRGIAFATPTAPGTRFCVGDGSEGACPCGNESPLGSGEGCENSSGLGAVLEASGTATAANDDLAFQVTQGLPGEPALLVQGSSQISTPFRDGLFCAGIPTERVEVFFLDGVGAGSTSGSIVTQGNVSPGQTRYYQAWFRDPGGVSPCGTGSNFTSGLIIDWL